MAHFAQLDDNNVVTQVIVVDNSELEDGNGVEQEAIGITFCTNLFGADTRWKQTSYNGNFRGQYAGIGYKYDPVNDVFVTPQPFPSWNLSNIDHYTWKPPMAMPDDGNFYTWNETTQQWDQVNV